ncbi:hypothetical protein C4K20_1224 [Pseudomonas chlororaphis subsp. aurantiaca]|nr:hypothetical protein C4K20_1224 [Pseudomonas chlororaphis subsp. aurantiaca]
MNIGLSRALARQIGARDREGLGDATDDSRDFAEVRHHLRWRPQP